MCPAVPVSLGGQAGREPVRAQLIDEGRPGFPGPTFKTAANQQLAVGLRQGQPNLEDPGPGFGHRFDVGRGDPLGPEVGVDVTQGGASKRRRVR